MPATNITLFALAYWSFQFASLFSFGLIVYVGYILSVFPSLFHFHRLNSMLLIFILSWATCTYVFNVYCNEKMQKDREIWETIGLWRYSFPGAYLFAQFCLGVLIAVGNQVHSSVFFFLPDGAEQSLSNDSAVEEKEETKVLIVATIVWLFSKCSRAIVMTIILMIAVKPGFIHALYIIFFMLYLLRPTIDWRMRQALILLCEGHFALLYILQLNLFAELLKSQGSWPLKVLSQVGLLEYDSTGDFLKIVLLACFCVIHNHGFELLFSFSAILQHAPCLPFGFSILKAGLNKSVLLSVYISKSKENPRHCSSHDRRIASYLGAIGQHFLSIYHSFGTYIAFLTILLTVYLVPPNYVSFGYLFFLLFWLTGRQIMGRTRRRLWFPLKLYSVIVFLLTYALSVSLSFRSSLSNLVDLHSSFGFNPQASAFENVWDSLAVLIVMQLHSYERRQSKSFSSDDYDKPDYNTCSFMRRLLVLHNEKILLIALFYASLSPVSIFGLIYLIGLVISSTLQKSCRVPSKFFSVYSGILLMVEYLFQMWGGQAGMLPGQKHYRLSQLVGLHLFKPDFWSLEFGLRGKIFVIISCMLQYVVFRWVENLPGTLGREGKWEEVFTLFGPAYETPTSVFSSETVTKLPITSEPLLQTQKENEKVFLSFKSRVSLDANTQHSGETRSFKDADKPNEKFSGISEGSGKWNKKHIISLRKERLQMQKTLLKVYVKFWIENMFNLFGLELNMIILLLCSFAILNSISLLYIAALAACILMKRHVIQKSWPIFVFAFGSVLILEYLAACKYLTSPTKVDTLYVDLSCHDCWKKSNVFFDYCLKCWLGIIVDDHRMLVSYWAVFMISCFKLRADQLSNLSNTHLYKQIESFRNVTCVLSDLSFETKCMWTSLDFLRLESYCHLLDFVLTLVLVTGTLEFDILHLGYLGFALVFFRMRLEILKKKNQIFSWLRVYNFALIVLSLAYQSPFVGDANEGKCDTSNYIYEIIGFYKYDYGFKITSRSALVEIIIFALVSLQSYMFESKEFDYVSMYLEAEQIQAALREQEKKAAWKTKQLLHIRRVEELKNQRNLQVEKMKAEMLNLQTELQRTTSPKDCGNTSSKSGHRRMSSMNSCNGNNYNEENPCRSFDSLNFEITESAAEKNDLKVSVRDIREHKEVNLVSFDNLDRKEIEKLQDRESPLKSALQLFGDGVSHVQSLGNLAVNNIVNLLNIDVEELISEEQSVENVEYYGLQSQSTSTFSINSDCGTVEALHAYISMLLRYVWAQMRSHNDVVCYCCFVLIFLWNFSLQSMFYLAGLFLYALCVHAGPSNVFWIITLMYAEFCILLQYLYQINIQHCGFTIELSFLQEIGFPGYKVTSSLVISNWPLFLVYLFTLLQSSITARDCEWAVIKELGSFRKKDSDKGEDHKSSNWLEKVERLLLSLIKVTKLILSTLYRYWRSLIEGAETPPYFVQLSMRVNVWPEDGIQPEKIGFRINRLLKIVNDRRSRDCSNRYPVSRIRVQSIEQSPENPNIALAVLEVLYASSLVEGIPVEWHHSLTPAEDVAKELLEGQREGLFEEIGFPYHVLSIVWGGKKEIDLYAYVFCADLVVFFLVAIFYQSIIKNKIEFLEVYQLEDQFPKEFVFILMIIFFLIVLDRVTYLRIYATGKVILYIFNLVLFTFAVTKYAWSTETSPHHSGRFGLRCIYLMKTISLALQAVQIRFGIPNRGTLYQQFLTSNVSRINYLAFRVYRALPFLHELRCVLDWSCTTTSLTMYDWLKLEDIHASLFLAKCDADLNRANHKQGQKQTKTTKFCNGICLFLVLIGVIWAPMLMYSSGNPTNIANPIKDAGVRVDIKTVSGRLTLYETTLCKMLSGEDLDIRTNLDPRGYLKAYDENDIQVICCQADASSMWLVPPIVQSRFIQSLGWSMDILFSWKFTRDRPKGKEVVRYELILQDHDSPRVEQVTDVLQGNTDSFAIYDIYPRYFRVTGSGDVRLLEEAVELVSANLTLHRASPGWWSFDDLDPLGVSDHCGPAGPVAVIVSEETPQGILGETLSHSSIWGLYITFVLAVGRFIRLQCADLRMRIPFENLPSCDRLLAICENIYTARAEGELEVEEVLYWTLVKIYRSPHMLLEYTKPD
ncbi:piezo-type mechanosensitive ion channel homolog isoform X2 [Silene latifolia]|uniref:piezo-type mechanosensitive ion channel homolog isoform X2 n=1 Tax=Silene latifolia TaxID=37657 RepID=UPI003D77CC2D